MLDFKIKQNRKLGRVLETSIHGKALLSISQLNKGLAFSFEERKAFGLEGKLPNRVESLEQQAQRAYLQFSAYEKKINRNLYLRQLHNTNEVLFYKLVNDHLDEMIPIIYTPIVGNVVREFNQRFSQPRGLYISYEDRDNIEAILENRSNPDVKIIVVSDGEGVLGIGDQGVGAMAIPIAKLMVYTAFAGINPLNTLPIMLDAGTNNKELLEDPFYIGLKKKRITGEAYDEFIEKFVSAVKNIFPNVFLHWEDFGQHNAYQNLIKYRQKITSFNDDIEGTGVVTLAACLAGTKRTNTRLQDQRFIVFGAGTAGMGVTHNLCNALIREGLTPKQARSHFWLVDRNGLITENATNITEAQKPYCCLHSDIAQWHVKDPDNISLLEVINHVKPTVLIGSSAQTGAFTKKIVKAMYQYCKQPIILPLSNPNEKCEATPKDLLNWTEGHALIATGSPFDPVVYNEQVIKIGQCNNYLAFPGIGLGIIAVKATQVNDEMLWAASEALSNFTNAQEQTLLPDMQQAKRATLTIAEAVAIAAIEHGLSKEKKENVKDCIAECHWTPSYLPYKRI